MLTSDRGASFRRVAALLVAKGDVTLVEPIPLPLAMALSVVRGCSCKA